MLFDLLPQQGKAGGVTNCTQLKILPAPLVTAHRLRCCAVYQLAWFRRFHSLIDVLGHAATLFKGIELTYDYNLKREIFLNYMFTNRSF